MIWCLSWRADPLGRELADRHYARQSVGAPQFVPPGRCVVLRTLAAGPGSGSVWIIRLMQAQCHGLAQDIADGVFP